MKKSLKWLPQGLLALSLLIIGNASAWDMEGGDIGCDNKGGGVFHCTQKQRSKRFGLPNDTCSRFGLRFTGQPDNGNLEEWWECKS